MGEQGSPSDRILFSKTMGPDSLSSVDSVNKQEQYKALYKQKELNTHDDAVWNTIIAMAKQEDEQGIATYLPTVPIDEMIAMGRLLQHDTTQDDRYHHLLQTCSDGETWYDIIHSTQNNRQLIPVFPLLDQEIQTLGKKFERGLDIGTGTGNVAQKIAPYCNSIVGIDLLGEAVQKASARKDIEAAATFVQGDAAHLPFTDNSVDLVISNGLTLYLPRNQEREQNEEINRVLKPGGLYVSIWVGPKEDVATMHIDGAKELLEDIMSSMIVGNAPPVSDQMGVKELAKQFMSKGYTPIFPPEEGKNFVVGFRKKQ
mgnify:FL=1